LVGGKKKKGVVFWCKFFSFARLNERRGFKVQRRESDGFVFFCLQREGREEGEGGEGDTGERKLSDD